MMSRNLFALILASFAIAPVCADEPKKDEKKEEKKAEPTAFYNSWAKFKPGTSVTLEQVRGGTEKSEKSTMTVTLVEVKEKDGNLVFEAKADDQPAEKAEVGKTDHGLGLQLPYDPKTGKLAGKFDEEGTEKLKVGGTEYECKWYKKKDKLPSGEVNLQMWVCDDVPGLLVKMVMKGGKDGSQKLDLAVKAVTIKK